MSKKTLRYDPLRDDFEFYPENRMPPAEWYEEWKQESLTQFFECQCLSNEHTIKFSLDEEDGTIYTSVYLNSWYPWYYKIWIALKYMFGYTSRLGHWDCSLLKTEDHPRLLALIAKSSLIQAEKLKTRLEQNIETVQTNSTNLQQPERSETEHHGV